MKKDSWLYSDSFLRRAFAIWGHYFVANAIIGIVVATVVLIIALIFGSAFAAFMSVMHDKDDGSSMMQQHDTMMDEDF